jgi:hypothetical protein
MISCCEVLEVQWSPASLDAYVILEAWVVPGRVCISGHRGRDVMLDELIRSCTPGK